MRKRLVCISTLLVSSIFMFVTLFSSSFDSMIFGSSEKSDNNSYSITLSESENKINTDSYKTRIDVSFYSSTKQNAFTHTIYNVTSIDGYWGRMLNGGYLVPKNIDFNQIQTINVNFDNPGSIYLHPAASYSQLRGNSIDSNPNLNGFEIVSGTTYDFSNSSINCYEIYSIEDTNIKSINVTYKCSVSSNKTQFGVISNKANHVKLTGSSNHKFISYLGLENCSKVDSYINISFKGKNMPNICLFTDSTSGQAMKGGNGLLLLTSFIENIDNDTTNTTRMMPYAPYRWSDTDDTTSRRYLLKALSGAGYTSSKDDETSYLTIYIDEFTSTSTANIDVTYSHGSTTVHKAMAINTASSGKDEKLYENTSLIFYGQGHDIEFDYSFSNKQIEEKVTHNSDGSITIAAGNINGSSTNYSSTHGYLGLPGDYDVGTKITSFFTGKNIPNICVFADTNYGSVISNDSKGIYIASDIGNNSSPFNERLTFFGPYRLCKTTTSNYGSDYRIYTAEPTSQNPFGLSCLNDSINYRYEVDLISLSYDLKLNICLSLFNNDTNELLVSTAFNQIYNSKDTSVSLSNCRKLLFYGQYKDITFSYNVSTNNFSKDNATLNSDGSITLKAGSADNTKSSLAYVGESDCGVGSTISTYFRGKNIPNICLFSSSTSGQAISPENTGLYLGTSLARDDESSDVRYDKRYVAYAPYRWSKTNADRAGTYRIKTILNSNFGFANLDDSINYRYDILLDSITNSNISVTCSLYNNSTSQLLEKNIISVSYTAVTSDIDLSKNTNVVFYGQYVDITFNYKINKTSEKEKIHTYGYATPTNGVYYEENEKKTTGVDYRNVERYIEYKEAGMDTLLLQGTDPYNGETWSTCQTKKNLDNALLAGLKRAIVFDSRIYKMSTIDHTLIGTDTDQYATMEDLVNVLKQYIKDYSKHEVFTGIFLVDEPSSKYFAAIHDIQNAFKLIDDEIECYENLLPYYATKAQLFTNGEDVSGLTQYQAYTKYLEDYVSNGNVKNLCMDSYPYRYNASKSANYFNTAHFPGLQIVADVASKNNIKPAYVLPTFEATKGKTGNVIFVKEDETMIRYVYNVALAMSPSQIGYFTYWRKQNSDSNEWFTDGSSFISQFGNKTNLYGWVQNIYTETTRIRDELTNYKYVSSTFLNSSLSGDALKEAIPGINISTTKPFMVTCLSNGTNKIYCIINIEDVFNRTSAQNKITITSQKTYAYIYSNSDYYKVNFKNDLSFFLSCGEAVFVKI